MILDEGLAEAYVWVFVGLPVLFVVTLILIYQVQRALEWVILLTN